MPERAQLPIRLMTRQLAEMQTRILSRALPLFDGHIDRFVIYTLIVRQSFPPGAAGSPGAISAHALALSLGKPFETVRRHVNALVGQGFCHRTDRGVAATALALQTPPLGPLVLLVHDSLVRFIADLQQFGVPMPPPRSGAAYDRAIGVRAAADIMLGVTDSNRSIHDDWLGLALFSAIFAANMRDISYDPLLARRHAAPAPPVPAALVRPVRSSVVARTIEVPLSTVHRRVERLIADGRVVRVREGLIVPQDWLNAPDAIATSANTYKNVRLVLWRIAAAGFPFDAPDSAYIGDPPGPVVFA